MKSTKAWFSPTSPPWGTHLERDLPRLLHEIALKYKGLRISSAPPLDGHPAFVRFSWIA
jgi:sirohydrochlorin ferrochelatase